MRQRTVLLVDDEPAIRESLRRLLQRAGWVVMTAPNPADAIAALSDRSADALILDVRMPGGGGQIASGLDLLAFLRTGTVNAATPVILLTGHFLSVQEEAFAERHGAKVLYKPADPHAICAELDVLCDTRGPLARGTA
jgi:DNA-binding response OmpR family regulator